MQLHSAAQDINNDATFRLNGPVCALGGLVIGFAKPHRIDSRGGAR
jgi:hypothetical protein